jgi:hypothetical protein
MTPGVDEANPTVVFRSSCHDRHAFRATLQLITQKQLGTVTITATGVIRPTELVNGRHSDLWQSSGHFFFSAFQSPRESARPQKGQ